MEDLAPSRTRIFISYSHKDKEYLESLHIHFKGSHIPQQQVDDSFWDDTRIPPGENWLQQIQEAMAAACVAVLLVSPDFMASDFINTHELPFLLAAAKRRELKLLPVILKPSAFNWREDTRLVQTVNPPSEPVIGMNELAQLTLWDKVARAVQEILNEQAAIKQAAAPVRQEPPPAAVVPAAPKAAPISPALPGFQDAAQTFLHEQRAHMLAHLRAFRFTDLFIEELGWNHYKKIPSSITVEGQSYTITAIAEKHGFAAYLCYPDPDGPFPSRVTRRKIEEAARQLVQEHLFIFIDQAKTQQAWQWVNSTGKHRVYRDIDYVPGKTEERLIRGLPTLAFDIVEEEILTIIPVIERFREVFDVERVTKKFYDRFKVEHAAFLKLIDGIDDEETRKWYTSLMLNRLMFTYFIQKKEFLNGEPDYLRERLKRVSGALGPDKFHSFYRSFLRHLFHQGLGLPRNERKQKLEEQALPELEALIGNVPYLNGGLFEQHIIERTHEEIQIPDEAFKRIFDFFDEFDWYLDDRPLHNDREINPDVLGYIFEKYINQKQMGAYYTKEDITGYISKNTIIPYLFEAARPNCAIAFKPDGEVWRWLRDDPDAYFYPAVLTGVKLPLPPEIRAGIEVVSQRANWNRPAPADYALPTETWREVVARRQRYQDVRARLEAGEITSINDLITYNLNIQQFTLDVIEHSEGPELLRAFWRAVEQVSVLDPTCGSGAFLFAALNLLEPLYEACLDRMQAFVDEADHTGETRRFPDFRAVLARVAQHPNRRYFILKSIIINNLYGVDIMEEAVEIARLRLFLKLVAQVDDASRIEPLPDIDFNIRAGNTLVGYATYAEVERAVTSKLDFDDTMGQIKQQADDLDRLFEQFREQQTTHGGLVTHEDKEELRRRLRALADMLDRYLAADYGIDERNIKNGNERARQLLAWRASHQPFHWFIEFYGIVHKRGGFDVIIGNPPYVEYSAAKFPYKLQNYNTLSCANLYTCVVERSYHLLPPKGYHGMILPLAAFATRNMTPFIEAFQQWFPGTWLSFYHFRPSMLFSGGKVASIPTTIFIAKTQGEAQRFSTAVNKWFTPHRESLFDTLSFCLVNVPSDPDNRHYYPKLGASIENNIMEKVLSQKVVSKYLTRTPNTNEMYYREAGGLYWKVFVNFEWPYQSISNKRCSFEPHYKRDAFVAFFNSSLFWWYYMVTFDTFHQKDYMLFGCHFSYPEDGTIAEQLCSLTKRLMEDYQANAEHLKRGATGSYTIYARKSKPIIDEIDKVLARHYGFTDEELDFIINYDIKYRMGQNGDEGDDEG